MLRRTKKVQTSTSLYTGNSCFIKLPYRKPHHIDFLLNYITMFQSNYYRWQLHIIYRVISSIRLLLQRKIKQQKLTNQIQEFWDYDKQRVIKICRKIVDLLIVLTILKKLWNFFVKRKTSVKEFYVENLCIFSLSFTYLPWKKQSKQDAINDAAIFYQFPVTREKGLNTSLSLWIIHSAADAHFTDPNLFTTSE